MTLLIKSAKLLDRSLPEYHGKTVDMLIVDGVISKIELNIQTPDNCKVVSLPNCHVAPGWFDSSVSFGEPGHEDRETLSNGLLVAGKSGFTGIVLNTNTHPVPDSSGDILSLLERGKNAVCDVFPMGTLSLGAKGIDLAELFDMHSSGAVGFSDYKSPVENPNLLKLALLYSQHFNGLIHSFPLDAQLGHKGQVNEGEVAVRLGLKGLPNLAEDIRISRDLAILEYTGGKLHIPTLSTGKSVARIAEAKKRGLDVTCSVAIHNLFFSDQELESFDSVYKVMPPLRSESDRMALIEGLKNGTIDFVCSDHSPMDVEEKRLEFDLAAFGSLGLESMFGALRLLFSAEDCAEILGRGRTRFGISENPLKIGNEANLTLFDPDLEYVETKDMLHSTSSNSMYLNTQLKGKAYGIIVGKKTNL